MLHHILHTDETRDGSLDELSEQPTILLQGLLSPGQHRIPGLPWYTCRVSITGNWLLATIKHDDRQCAMFGIALTQEAANQLWQRLEEFYFQLTEMPGIRSIDLPVSRRPTETPWCASVRMEITPDEVTWIDFFERCLAWAWLKTIAH